MRAAATASKRSDRGVWVRFETCIAPRPVISAPGAAAAGWLWPRDDRTLVALPPHVGWLSLSLWPVTCAVALMVVEPEGGGLESEKYLSVDV